MRYFIKTFGCQMNFSDSERMMTFFEQQGFQPAKRIDQADLVVFNSCGVRQTAEDRVYGLVHNQRQTNHDSFIVVTGCLAHRKDVQKKLRGKADLFLPIADFPTILEKFPRSMNQSLASQDACETTIANEGSKQSMKKFGHYLCIEPKYKYADLAFVPIMTGCNNFCSYCVVPYARGREWSRPFNDIFNEIKKLNEKDCQEVVLLGQNVNSYSQPAHPGEKKQSGSSAPSDNQVTDFPKLLGSLAKTFPSIKFRFLTSHPKDFSLALMQVIASHKNIAKTIHLPIQSGSDRILKAMNRPYSRQHYLSLIEQAKKIIPRVNFSTDVIVGFPGETDEDFLATADIFEKIGFAEAFINKYSPRPGTAAYKLGDPIKWEEKKLREKKLRQLVKPAE